MEMRCAQNEIWVDTKIVGGLSKQINARLKIGHRYKIGKEMGNFVLFRGVTGD